MFGRNSGDADRTAKSITRAVNATNRRGTPKDSGPSKAAADVPAKLSRAVAKAAKRGKGSN